MKLHRMPGACSLADPSLFVILPRADAKQVDLRGLHDLACLADRMSETNRLARSS